MNWAIMSYRLLQGARRVLEGALARQLLHRAEVSYTALPACYGVPVLRLAPGSRVTFGDNVMLISGARYNPIGVNHPCIFNTVNAQSRVRIGSHVGMSGVSLCAQQLVQIGDHVMIGADVIITDTDLHSLDYRERRRETTTWRDMGGARSQPVIIGDDVFIGARAIILKGTTLGQGCQVGAGAVVQGSFAPFSVIVGNPARCIKTLGPDQEPE